MGETKKKDETVKVGSRNGEVGLETEARVQGVGFGEVESMDWKPGAVVHTCNPRTQELESGGLQIPGQRGLYREI